MQIVSGASTAGQVAGPTAAATLVSALQSARLESAMVMDPSDYSRLPPDLPVPIGDGACDHLPGMNLPAIPLASTSGKSVTLASLKGTTVLYCYPRSGRPGVPLPVGWDQIPGARGCTPQTCAFRDQHREFERLNVAVYGLSTQSTEYQQEFAGRLHLPFELLSDSELRFCTALRLPTFIVDGETLIKRLTLILRDGRIEKVFYPVFPPDQHAGQLLRWFDGERGRG
jgi:peroxiredoxin